MLKAMADAEARAWKLVAFPCLVFRHSHRDWVVGFCCRSAPTRLCGGSCGRDSGRRLRTGYGKFDVVCSRKLSVRTAVLECCSYGICAVVNSCCSGFVTSELRMA